MRHPILLKRFEYSVPHSPTAVNVKDSREVIPIDKHLPLVNVDINFEAKTLFLEGNSRLMLPTARKSKLKRSAGDKGRIRVSAAIHPGLDIDLTDFTSDGLVFALEGTINDGESITSCSGLLMLEREIGRQGTGVKEGTGGREWNLTLYLYDDYDNAREIKLRLVMYSISETAQLN